MMFMKKPTFSLKKTLLKCYNLTTVYFHLEGSFKSQVLTDYYIASYRYNTLYIQVLQPLFIWVCTMGLFPICK